MKNENRIIQVNDIPIGLNIKTIRQSKGLRQIDIVAKLQLLGINISISSYSKIEAGRQNPTVSLLFALTQIFQCDFNTLFSC